MERDLKKLVASMTLEEKAGMCSPTTEKGKR